MPHELEINRIDISTFPTLNIARVTHMHEYPVGRGFAQEKIVKINEYPLDSFTIDDKIAWMQSHGYYVRSWPGGARGWKGDKPRPVRTAREIFKLRERLERTPRPELNGVENTLMLEFDL